MFFVCFFWGGGEHQLHLSMGTLALSPPNTPPPTHIQLSLSSARRGERKGMEQLRLRVAGGGVSAACGCRLDPAVLPAPMGMRSQPWPIPQCVHEQRETLLRIATGRAARGEGAGESHDSHMCLPAAAAPQQPCPPIHPGSLSQGVLHSQVGWQWLGVHSHRSWEEKDSDWQPHAAGTPPPAACKHSCSSPLISPCRANDSESCGGWVGVGVEGGRRKERLGLDCSWRSLPPLQKKKHS